MGFVSACTKEEPDFPEFSEAGGDNRIEFAAELNPFASEQELLGDEDENRTRAVSTFGPIDLSALQGSADGFSVVTSGLGSNMNNVPVTYSGGQWRYSGDYFWPLNASQNITFTAYAPAGAAGTSLTAAGFTVTNFVPDPTVANQVDLIYAQPASFNRNGASGGVPLSFRHLLTQVVFSIKTDVPASSNPRVVSLVLTVPASKGSYSSSSNSWNNSLNSVSYSVFNNNPIGSTPIYATPMLMIPQTNLLLSTPTGVINLTVNGVPKTKTFSLGVLTLSSWPMGAKITYNISVSQLSLLLRSASDEDLDVDVTMTVEQSAWDD